MPNPGRPYQFAKIPEVQELLDQGKTHAEIKRKTGVPPRTVSRWLKKELVRRPSPVPVVVAPTDAPERAPDQEWTARALLEIGMDPAAAERSLLVLERTAATSNPRFREWLSRYIPLSAKVPDEWAAAIAFLPILGRDIYNPVLETLAELMHESVPWEDRLLRRRYGRLAEPLLRAAEVELNDWMVFLSNTEMAAEPPVREAAVILEVLGRCPHVDRPVRRRRPVHKEDRMFGLHLLREMPMGVLALSWGRLVESAPPWLEAYGDYTRKFVKAAAEQKGVQDPCGTRLVQVETLVFGRRSWLKWPRWGTRRSR